MIHGNSLPCSFHLPRSCYCWKSVFVVRQSVGHIHDTKFESDIILNHFLDLVHHDI